jgi:predicted kinase
MSVVVVVGAPGAGAESLAQALAERLDRMSISLEAIVEHLAASAADTPRHWLRLDAELELVRLLAACGGEAVVAIGFAEPGDAARVATLLDPWWDDLVELRCEAPGERPQPLGAPRTVVLDTSRPVALGDVVSAVRIETGTGPSVVRR